MPIEGVSDILRLPRLGKIRLGEKVEKPGKIPYPRALDHFKCPPEVQEVYGEQPKQLDIMFPTENPTQFAQQWLRCYSMTQGLVCIGDGRTCRRKCDTETGDIAGHTTKKWEWKDGLPCNPEHCPHYGPRCKRCMNLQFILPKLKKGFGVWQIDTSSFYSIVNINSAIEMVARAAGRISFIPLPLCLGPQEVSPPGEKKKTVHVLYIDMMQVSLAQLMEWGQKAPHRMLTTPEPQVEEPPDDLWAQDESGELAAHWAGEEPDEAVRDEALAAEEAQQAAKAAATPGGRAPRQGGPERTKRESAPAARAAPSATEPPPEEEGECGIPQKDWTDFWTWARSENLSIAQVCTGLGADSPQAWLATDPKHTLADAKAALTEKYQLGERAGQKQML